jgi:DNA polymerase-4
MQRKIIHIDMDCFYAAVEVRENPALRGKPVAVGGNPQGRGVVATCSYEARRYGVHSAMPMSTALSKCPGLAVLPVNMALYKQVSATIQAIFREYTPLVEPLSLDEAFLDVTGIDRCQGSATLIAEEIRQRIYSSQRLTASAGIAPNKFLAKIASDWHKPNGQKVITPGQIADFVKALPVGKIFGVGKVTAAKMQKLGIATCGDLQQWSIEDLQKNFGSFGPRLHELSRGIDDREVKTKRVRKSLSVEDTFARDLPSLEACNGQLERIYRELEARLVRARQTRTLLAKSLFVKLRFNDFETTTVQARGDGPEMEAYRHLLAKAWQRGRKPVRLIGLGLQFAEPDSPQQLSLALAEY